MSRHGRVSPDGFVQHVLNRGDHRETLFYRPGDFRAFLAVVAETAHRIPMRILAYCIMRNHFHLVLWPYVGADLPRFMQLLMNLHIRRYLRHYPPASPGHLYQGRYKNSLIESAASLYRVIQYVEANAQSAGLVRRAEDYKWSSASRHATDFGRPTISEWPLPRPANWQELIAKPLSVEDLQRIQQSAKRGAPYGSERWVKTVVGAHQLEHTLRPRGRPRVYEHEIPEGEQTTQT